MRLTTKSAPNQALDEMRICGNGGMQISRNGFFNVGALFDRLAVACEMDSGHRPDCPSAAGQSLEGGA